VAYDVRANGDVAEPAGEQCGVDACHVLFLLDGFGLWGGQSGLVTMQVRS
jgi:hypothetical protein